MQTNSNPWLPDQVNSGPWLTHYTVNELESKSPTERVALPICSLGASPGEVARSGSLLLPPLYHEVLDAELKSELLARIRDCFP